MKFEMYLINLGTEEREKIVMNLGNIKEFEEMKYLLDKNNKYRVSYANVKEVVAATIFYEKEPVAFFFFAHEEDKEILIEILKENNLYNNFYEHENYILGYKVIEEKYFNEYLWWCPIQNSGVYTIMSSKLHDVTRMWTQMDITRAYFTE